MLVKYEQPADKQQQTISLLVREWNGETWEFGPLKEV